MAHRLTFVRFAVHFGQYEKSPGNIGIAAAPDIIAELKGGGSNRKQQNSRTQNGIRSRDTEIGKKQGGGSRVIEIYNKFRRGKEGAGE